MKEEEKASKEEPPPEEEKSVEDFRTVDEIRDEEEETTDDEIDEDDFDSQMSEVDAEYQLAIKDATDRQRKILDKKYGAFREHSKYPWWNRERIIPSGRHMPRHLKVD